MPASSLTSIDNIRLFLGLFHRQGERFFMASRPARQKVGWRDWSVDGLETAARFCLQMRGTHDVYFSMSNFAAHATSRVGENVIGSRSLWLDIDVDPTPPAFGEERTDYPTLQQAAGALVAFRKAFLPPTLTVGSGGGLHAYWLTAELMPVPLLAMLAAKLKEATRQRGLLADHRCTADKARVLRPLGSFNHNASRPVIVLSKGQTVFSPQTLDTALDKVLAGQRRTPVIVAAPSPSRLLKNPS